MVEKLYESLFVGCLYEEDHDEKEAAFFIPQLKVKERDGDTTKCFQVDTSFMSKQKGTMSFLLYMEGTIGQGIQQLGTTREFPSPILPFPRHTVILEYFNVKESGLTNFAFQSFYKLIGTKDKNIFQFL